MSRTTASASRPWAAATFVLIAAMIAYAPAMRAPFQFDDLETIAGNTSIQHLVPLQIPLHPPADIGTTGRPVVNLSFAVNYALNDWLGVDQAPGSHDPNLTTGYHVVNLLLHLLTGALLFGVVRRTLLTSRIVETWREHADGIALAVASLWLLHPIQAEAVNYLTQRTELLVSACYLGTLYAAIRAWEAPAPRSRNAWYIGSLVIAMIGMGSKEVMVTAPLGVLLYARAFHALSWRDALRVEGGRRWYHVALFVSALIVAWSVVSGARAETVGFDLGITWRQYLYTQAWAVARYLRLMVWPSGFVIDYGRNAITGLRGIPGAVLLASLLAAAIVMWRKRPGIAFLASWFFVLLAPSSSVVPIRTEVAAERRVYLAFAAVATAAVLGLLVWLRHSSARQAFTPGRVRAGFVALCLFLAGLTYRRSEVFASPETLWREAVDRVPDNPRARQNLALAMMQDSPDRLPEAEAQLRAAVAADSSYLPAYPNLATVVGLQGRTAEERQLLEKVVRKSPDYIAALQQLGEVLIVAGEPHFAIVPLEKVAAKAPSDASQVALAAAYRGVGRLRDAELALRKAIDENAARTDAMLYLAATLTEQGQGADAMSWLKRVRDRGVSSAFVEALTGLALAEQGDAAGAAAAVRTVLTGQDVDATVLVAVGRTALVLHQPKDAKRMFELALDRAPGDPDAEVQLGVALEQLGDPAGARRHFENVRASHPYFVANPLRQ